MIKFLINFIRKFTWLYNLIEKCYIIFRRLRFKIEGTKLEEKYWAKRHLRKGDDWYKRENGDWVKGYWDATEHSHRQFLIDKISKYNPLSILEIGCNCGPNLRLLAKKLPQSDIVGIDINNEAVKKGNEWLLHEGILNVKLYEGKADELFQFGDKSFDVVFTDAVLIYIGPDKIKKVIKEMLRVSHKVLIILEWHDFDSKYSPHGKYIRHWLYDYKILFKEFVSESQIEIIKLPNALWQDKNWQKYGAVIEVKAHPQPFPKGRELRGK